MSARSGIGRASVQPVFTEVLSTNRSCEGHQRKLPSGLRSDELREERRSAGRSVTSSSGKARPDALEANPNLTKGSGNRDYYWDTVVELQHELAPGMSLLLGYNRNWSDHFRGLPRGDFRTVYLRDNTSITADDFEPYCIIAPIDSRLPGGGGYEVCGLFQHHAGEVRCGTRDRRTADSVGTMTAVSIVTHILNMCTAN